MNQDQNITDGNGEGVAEEATAVTKQTTETLMAGERIMEALELADTARAEPADAPSHPILAALNQGPEEYVLGVVQKISSTALHDALLVLPFGKVLSLMVYLDEWAKRVSSFAIIRELRIETKPYIQRNGIYPLFPAFYSSSSERIITRLS